MEMPFSKFYRDMEQFKTENKPALVNIDPSGSPIFNNELFMRIVSSLTEMDDQSVFNFIMDNFERILRVIFTGVNDLERIKYVEYFRNIKFISAFNKALQTKMYLKSEEVTKCNSICYDYITSSKEKDPAIYAKILEMSSIVNRPYVVRLLGIGASNELANMLCISRFSSLIHDVMIKRVNFIIINSTLSFMTQDRIVGILDILFNNLSVQNWSLVFPSYMQDVLPEQGESNADWLTDEMEEIASVMDLAVLQIINQMPMDGIRDILVNYTEAYSMLGSNKRKRFTLNSLNYEDFYRINEVINNLRNIEGIFVP